jgi:hypothetical protein
MQLSLRKIALELAGIGLLGGGVALSACTALTGSSVASNVAVSTYVPLTSIEVDSASLFERRGCGAGSGVPFKYVVSVYDAVTGGERIGTVAIDIGASDCFTDALFQNVPTTQGVNYDWFSLTVDVFDEPTYEANRDLIDGPDVGNAAAIHGLANWSTTCVAQQQPNVQSIAACDPLP